MIFYVKIVKQVAVALLGVQKKYTKDKFSFIKVEHYHCANVFIYIKMGIMFVNCTKMVQSKLFPFSGSAALRQLNHIHKKRP